uniref:Transposase-associated domain-containing protein n=1 Tax=Brassica oleracea var. oleracea TaxID=109376 RepID=A0A0D3BTN0_BRAOL
MSSEVYYRSWMDKPHLDPNTNLLTEEYVQGIGEFMRLVQQQPDAKSGMLRCPCSTCNNNKVIKEFDVWISLKFGKFVGNSSVYTDGIPTNLSSSSEWRRSEDEPRPAARLRRSSVSSSHASGSSHEQNSVRAYIPAPAPAAPPAAAQQDPGVMPVELLVQQPGREHLPVLQPNPRRGHSTWVEHQPDDVLHAPFWIFKVECDPFRRTRVVVSSVCEFNWHSDLTETVRKKFKKKAMDSYTKLINAWKTVWQKNKRPRFINGTVREQLIAHWENWRRKKLQRRLLGTPRTGRAIVAGKIEANDGNPVDRLQLIKVAHTNKTTGQIQDPVIKGVQDPVIKGVVDLVEAEIVSQSQPLSDDGDIYERFNQLVSIANK